MTHIFAHELHIRLINIPVDTNKLIFLNNSMGREQTIFTSVGRTRCSYVCLHMRQKMSPIKSVINWSRRHVNALCQIMMVGYSNNYPRLKVMNTKTESNWRLQLTHATTKSSMFVLPPHRGEDKPRTWCCCWVLTSTVSLLLLLVWFSNRIILIEAGDEIIWVRSYLWGDQTSPLAICVRNGPDRGGD